MVWRSRHYLLPLLLFLLPVRVVAGASVWFLFDKQNEYHATYVQNSVKKIHAVLPDVKMRYIGLDEEIGSAIDKTGNTLIVSVGSSAAQKAAESKIPTLNTLTTRRKFDEIKGLYGGAVTAIFIDQPVSRYVQLIKSALPERQSLTVMLGAESQAVAKELKWSSSKLGLSLTLDIVTDEGNIDKIFARDFGADNTLLLLPDPMIVNRRTVKPLVLGSYRKGIPLVGYSQALVKAGALMAVYSPPSAQERQMVLVVRNYFNNGVLSAPRHTADFEIAVNYQLARALKISLPSESELKRRLQEQLR